MLAGICVLVLLGILTAGLWPFHAPRNEVTWLADSRGVRLGRHGTILSGKPFQQDTASDGRSIEIWLQPGRSESSSTILAFYNSNPRSQFSLHQSKANLGLQADLYSATSSDLARVGYVSDIFRSRASLFLTITSGTHGTAVYVDGVLNSRFLEFHPGNQAFTGRLVLGTSPLDNNGWSGRLFALAIYDRELTPEQAGEHYKSWTAQGSPGVPAEDRSSAVYLFQEQTGNTIHNQTSSGVDLVIPENYSIVDEKFLEPFWQEFHWELSYGKNALINIVGFLPLGYFFYAWWSARHLRRVLLFTVLLGAATSLTIEVLQAFLPTRDSGTTDLITNTLGTYLGILIYRWKPALLYQALALLPFPKRPA